MNVHEHPPNGMNGKIFGKLGPDRGTVRKKAEKDWWESFVGNSPAFSA